MTDISVDSPFQIADNKKSPWLRLTYTYIQFKYKKTPILSGFSRGDNQI